MSEFLALFAADRPESGGGEDVRLPVTDGIGEGLRARDKLDLELLSYEHEATCSCERPSVTSSLSLQLPSSP